MTIQQPLITPAESRDTDVDSGAIGHTDVASDDVELITQESARAHSRDTETPYLPDQTSAQAHEKWQRIQAEFVDDPRKSVAGAHQLVGEVVQRIVDAFAQERSDLERQWSKGGDVSTEDLRICLQRYRAFFSRLLPSMNGLDTH
jgi:hypothetical protein